MTVSEETSTSNQQETTKLSNETTSNGATSHEKTPVRPKNSHDVESAEHMQELLSKDLEVVSVLYFRVDWAKQCKEMDQVTQELAIKYPKGLFLEIQAEVLPEISEDFDIVSVPEFLILRGHVLLDRISGARAKELSDSVERHVNAKSIHVLGSTSKASGTSSAASSAREETKEELVKRCKEIMNSSAVVLFMKGTPAVPQCGFSRSIVKLLKDEGIKFETFNILEDEGVRQELKKLNEFPTFPQLIVGGELVGGLDIIKEMVEADELKELVDEAMEKISSEKK